MMLTHKSQQRHLSILHNLGRDHTRQIGSGIRFSNNNNKLKKNHPEIKSIESN
jgi:hypothetical protein